MEEFVTDRYCPIVFVSGVLVSISCNIGALSSFDCRFERGSEMISRERFSQKL